MNRDWISVERCTARSGRTGTRCGRWPTTGSNVCRSHGSAAPRVQRAAARRIAEQKATAVLARQGFEPLANPLTALAELAGEVVGIREVFREKFASLIATNSLRYIDKKGSEQLRSEALIYERYCDRSTKLLVDMARIDLADRLVKLSERQANLVAQVLRAALIDFGLDPADDDVRQAVGRHLQALEGPA